MTAAIISGDSELIEMMCYGDVDSMNWLSDHGFTWKKKTVAIVGSIWMRCKASDTYASGQGFINVISDAIQNEKLDVTTVFECRAEHLVKDDAGPRGRRDRRFHRGRNALHRQREQGRHRRQRPVSARTSKCVRNTTKSGAT